MTPDSSQLNPSRNLRDLDTTSQHRSVEQVCNPDLATLPDAIRKAKLCLDRSAIFRIKLATFLRAQSLAEHIHLPTILRGLEVLESITEEGDLLSVLRCFLRSDVPQIASKCVLIFGRRCPRTDWMRQVMLDGDDRVRANLIESLWGHGASPDIRQIFNEAMHDQHHRVAANAAFGLFLSGHEEHNAGIEKLISNNDPAYRRAGIWLLKTIGNSLGVARLKPLILDSDPAVRRAAFAALVFLRERAALTRAVELTGSQEDRRAESHRAR